jgi:uncharacterized membrane protein YfcA
LNETDAFLSFLFHPSSLCFMPKRLAAAVSLVIFFVCLLGGAQVGNSFGTTVGRALLAMVVTLVIGLIVGTMLESAIDENLSRSGEKNEKSGMDSSAGDR